MLPSARRRQRLRWRRAGRPARRARAAAARSARSALRSAGVPRAGRLRSGAVRRRVSRPAETRSRTSLQGFFALRQRALGHGQLVVQARPLEVAARHVAGQQHARRSASAAAALAAPMAASSAARFLPKKSSSQLPLSCSVPVFLDRAAQRRRVDVVLAELLARQVEAARRPAAGRPAPATSTDGLRARQRGPARPAGSGCLPAPGRSAR